MNILIISQYYPPEIGAAANRIGEYAELLAKNHDVTVLTSAPNYPDGKIYAGFRNKLSDTTENGVRVIRVPVFLSSKKTRIGRVLHYLSFMISAFRHGRRLKKPAIIWASSPPLSIAILAYKLAKKLRTKFVFDIRDIWPASVQDVGAVKNSFLLSGIEKCAHKLYNAAAGITATSQGIAEQVPQYAEKITVIPNGINEELFADKPHENPLPQEIRDKKIVLYTGNLGLAQATGVVVEAAQQLTERDDIHFVIVGSGVEADAIRDQAEQKNLTNILFTGVEPREKIPTYIAAATVCLVPYKARETFRHTLPSKLFDYMAGAKPVIINLAGEAGDLIKKAECGFVAKEEDPNDLAKYIAYFADDLEVAQQMGKNGLQYAKRHFRRSVIAKQLEQALERATIASHGTVPLPRQRSS